MKRFSKMGISIHNILFPRKITADQPSFLSASTLPEGGTIYSLEPMIVGRERERRISLNRSGKQVITEGGQ